MKRTIFEKLEEYWRFLAKITFSHFLLQVDDLALPLYPPMSLEEVENESKNLSQELIEIINSLKTVHFVSDKDCEEWAAFLLKAVDHNMTKINLALTNEKFKSLKT